MNNIPLLTEKDVECRVQQVTTKGYAILLLYKNARVDMNILDAVFGPENWQRHHEIINGNLYCTVSVWDEEKKQWISKQDVGTESQTEAQKSQASDSFKRACFNWGIGRELYNAPFICVQLASQEVEKGKSGKNTTRTKFSVQAMEYDTKNEAFTKLIIIDQKGNVRYNLGSKVDAPEPTTSAPAVEYVKNIKGVTCVLGNDGKWYQLETMQRKGLEAILHEAKYAKCHAEARRLLGEIA